MNITKKLQLFTYTPNEPVLVSALSDVNSISYILSVDSNGVVIRYTDGIPNFLQQITQLNTNQGYMLSSKSDATLPYEIYASTDDVPESVTINQTLQIGTYCCNSYDLLNPESNVDNCGPSPALFTFDDPTPSFDGTFNTSTYTNGPMHGRGQQGSDLAFQVFAGGVLTASGKVVLVPSGSTNVGIYDPVANTYTDGPTHGRGSQAFNGGVLTPSGKVVLVPYKSTTVGIYDPVANTYTDGPTHGRGDAAFLGGALTSSGKVVFVPFASTNVGIYDPVANTYTDGPGRGSQAFNGGVLTPSGKVVLVPYQSTTVGIYDPVANTYTDGPTHGRGAYAFGRGALTPSGKVVFVPFDSTNVGIYDPVANTYTDGPTHGRGAYAFGGGVLTPSGKVVLVPWLSTTVGILTPDPLLSVSLEAAMSPYINKL